MYICKYCENSLLTETKLKANVGIFSFWKVSGVLETASKDCVHVCKNAFQKKTLNVSSTSEM